jgi:hypothetical protein
MAGNSSRLAMALRSAADGFAAEVATSSIAYLAGLRGSNEAKATTGSDALNSMDSVRPDGYRDRPLT